MNITKKYLSTEHYYIYLHNMQGSSEIIYFYFWGVSVLIWPTENT